jgi:hypothetical protein
MDYPVKSPLLDCGIFLRVFVVSAYAVLFSFDAQAAPRNPVEPGANRPQSQAAANAGADQRSIDADPDRSERSAPEPAGRGSGTDVRHRHPPPSGPERKSAGPLGCRDRQLESGASDNDVPPRLKCRER